MKNDQQNKEIIIYQTKSGVLELRADLGNKTIWANRMEMAQMFEVNPPAISKHIRNIYKEKELLRQATSSKMELIQNEAGRIVKRRIDIYNLDVLIAVGYRINSVTGTKFRQWATKTLRSYITDGYAINRNRIAKNYQQFMQAVDDVKRLLPSGAKIDTGSILELINMFACTWLSLDAYDKDSLSTKGATKKDVSLSVGKLTKNLYKLKQVLITKGEASDIFGLERRSGALSGIVGNVMQRFADQELYDSVEEKAAHLLYFIVKDHPFADGNKRSGAFSFVWFLQQAKILDKTKITSPALTALTILVAESKPREKHKMIKLILTLLK